MGAFGSLGGSGMSHSAAVWLCETLCALWGGSVPGQPFPGVFPPPGCSVGLWMWVCAGVSFRVGAAVRCQFLTACSLFSPPPPPHRRLLPCKYCYLYIL